MKPAAEALAQTLGRQGRAGEGEAGLNLQQVFSLEVIIFSYILLCFPNFM